MQVIPATKEELGAAKGMMLALGGKFCAEAAGAMYEDIEDLFLDLGKCTRGPTEATAFDVIMGLLVVAFRERKSYNADRTAH